MISVQQMAAHSLRDVVAELVRAGVAFYRQSQNPIATQCFQIIAFQYGRTKRNATTRKMHPPQIAASEKLLMG